MTEKEIETQILTWLNYQKSTWAFKINTTGIWDPTRKTFRTLNNPFTMPGCSDILGIAHGKFLAIEVKTPTTLKRFNNRPSLSDQRQKAFLDRVSQLGGISRVTDCLKDIETWFLSVFNRLL
jgi:penicillin-binding protein-related factor A (putative recombinase)